MVPNRVRFVIVLGALAACGQDSGSSATSAATPPTSVILPTTFPTVEVRSHVVVEASFTPVCGPSNPTDASCSPLLLDGVEITVRRPSGAIVAMGTTDSAGNAAFELVAGDYLVEGAPDSRAHITPQPLTITVSKDTSMIVRLRYASAFQ